MCLDTLKTKTNSRFDKNKIQAFKVKLNKTTYKLSWCTYGKNTPSCRAHAKTPLFPCKEKTMRQTFIQSHTTLIYMLTASKGKKQHKTSHGLTNCHGDSYTHDQTSSRRCKGLDHATSTTRRQTLNLRLANKIAFWATKNGVGRPEIGLGEQRIGLLFRVYVSVELRWGLLFLFCACLLSPLNSPKRLSFPAPFPCVHFVPIRWRWLFFVGGMV